MHNKTHQSIKLQNPKKEGMEESQEKEREEEFQGKGDLKSMEVEAMKESH